jgi:uncharacterized protein (TIGR04551 family)
MAFGSSPRFPILLALAAPFAWANVALAQQAGGGTPSPSAPSSAQPTQAAGPAPSGSLLPASPSTGAAAPAAPGTGPSVAPAAPIGEPTRQGSSISPTQDAQSLMNQGAQRPPGDADGSIGAKPSEVYAEDWWSHTRPILEVHGYFRTRGELFHNFALGRHGDDVGHPTGLWPQPLDITYTAIGNQGPKGPNLCGFPQAGNSSCSDKSQASANLRFRLNPEIHISDNLRILSQIDALDNLVLGSTPDAYANTPSKNGGFAPAGYNGYAPLGFNSTTQGPPTAGVNGYRNSIDVKRVWAEYMTPVGQLRFGRMPDQWGLGMVHNAGDSIDSDYQSTVDRIMFVSGLRSSDLYFGGSWDFVATGPTSATPYDVYGGQPYDTAQLTNVFQWSLFAAHRTNPDLQRLSLSRGDLVVNGGLYTNYRTQYLDIASGYTPQTFSQAAQDTSNGLERRSAWALTPDAWLQVLWKKFRFEAEFAAVWGEIGSSPGTSAALDNTIDVRQFGLTTQTEYRAVEDKLHLQFGFGWASGDSWSQSLNPSSGATPPAGPQVDANGGRGPLSTFSFHPDYRVDLIFFRHILSRVEGAYYFRPSVDYDFLRHQDGQKFGGGAAIIWSRASEFMQAPGHHRDLGVELDLQLYYQAKDGSLNDNPEKLGGFYTMLQYGVFFPLGGLSYTSNEVSTAGTQSLNLDTSAAQTVRLFLGVAY